MGIRFLCPNGHKLNVKAFLAGKRGICPHCDAKFLVPKQSGVQADVLDDTHGPTGESVVLDPSAALPLGYGATTSPLASPPAPPAPTAPPQEVPSSEEVTEVWYVRTAAGEQYGPASTPVMQTWVSEGRVAVDCWVWRTGWPDWKTGGHAITLLNGPIQEPAGPTAPAVSGVPSNPAPESLPESTSPTVVYQNTRRNRQERARKVTFFLASVVLLLFAVLIAVLIRNSS